MILPVFQLQLKLFIESLSMKKTSITSRLFLLRIYFHSVLLTCDLKYKEVSSQ